MTYRTTTNNYTGSVYTSECTGAISASDFEYYYSSYQGLYCYPEYIAGTKIKEIDASIRLRSILVCLILTVIVCIPICSFMCLTKKRVYKKGANQAQHGEGIHVDVETDNVAPGEPVVQETDRVTDAAPHDKSSLIEKEEIVNS